MNKYLIYLFCGVLAFIPALIWLIIWYKKDSEQPEPKKMILESFYLGCLSVMPFFGIKYAMNQADDLQDLWYEFAKNTLYLSQVILILLLAFLEESIKHFAVLRLGKSLKIEFDQIVDGVIYSVSCALGFAFMENIIYFANNFYGEINASFLYLFAFRSLGTMLGHAIFSGIFGLFWGFAFLSMSITNKHNFSVSNIWHKLTDTLRLHIIRDHVLRGRSSTKGHEKGDLVREALIVATLLHGLFNIFVSFEIMGKSLTFMVVPLLMGGFVFLSHSFLQKKNLKIWKKAI